MHAYEYDVFLHQTMAIKYSQLPGPKGLPIIGNFHQVDIKNLHNHLEEWASEYGGVFRLKVGPSKVTVVTDVDISQQILKLRPESFIRMKKIDSILKDAGVHGVFNAEGEEWKLHRKIIAKGLDVKHQQEFFPKMKIILNRLYNKWSSDAEKGIPTDIQQDFLRFTVDVTTSLAFGYEMNTIEEKGGVVQDHMEKIFPMIFWRLNTPIPWYKWFKSKKDKDYEFALSEIDKLIDTLIQQGKQRLSEHPELRENPTNILEAILVAAESESSFGDSEVKGNLLTLLMAGEDTTAHTLAWSIYLLTKHPEKQQVIRDEVDSLFNGNPFIQEYSDQHLLKQLDYVASETMRIKPVAPLLLFEPIKDIVLNGYHFEKGSRVLLQTRFQSLQESNFTNATTFTPERWGRISKCPMHNVKATNPFGGGPRYCPGKNLALMEIKLALSTLFKNFDVEMLTPHEDIKEIMAFTMMSSNFKVQLKKRNS